MKKDKILVLAALSLSASFMLASCSGEPAGEHSSPEATQGDYLGNDDLDTTDTATDTTSVDTTETIL
jgi:PBP1b-binding outer membrane lipoprotein LpoB